MKDKLDCRVVDRDALADHLRHCDITRSETAGEASVYHCRGEDGDSIAVALPGDSALIITPPQPSRQAVDRRRPRR